MWPPADGDGAGGFAGGECTAEWLRLLFVHAAAANSPPDGYFAAVRAIRHRVGDAALAQLLWRLALGSEGDAAIQLAVATLCAWRGDHAAEEAPTPCPPKPPRVLRALVQAWKALLPRVGRPEAARRAALLAHLLFAVVAGWAAEERRASSPAGSARLLSQIVGRVAALLESDAAAGPAASPRLVGHPSPPPPFASGCVVTTFALLGLHHSRAQLHLVSGAARRRLARALFRRDGCAAPLALGWIHFADKEEALSSASLFTLY